MSGTFGGPGFGFDTSKMGESARRFGSELWEAMDQLRGSFEQRVNTRMGKGDVRAAVLALLAEQPMHGYQIIREIEERSGGAWKPSAGSVYPTLQLLADEGLVVATETDGRKTYALTEAGRAVADDAEKPAPWESFTGHDFRTMSAVPKAGMELAQVVAQVAREGSAEQKDEAVAVLEEARRKLHSILAQD